MISDLKPYPAMKDSGVPWLGEVPEHWEVRPLRQIGRFGKGNGGNKDEEVPKGIPCVRYGDLYTTHTYFIHRSRSFVSAAAAKNYTPITYGDVLFACSGETIDDIGKSAVNLIRDEAVCGGDVLVLRPQIEADARFLGYAMDCRPAAAQKARMGRGITVKHIYGDELKDLTIALPPLAEQRGVAAFLSQAELRIRRYIRAKQKLIKLLEEQKQAIIHRAVTRGLDPNVRLKPSGVDWLGDVPEHWGVERVKHVARLESGHTPSRTDPRNWLDDNDIPWVSLNDTKALDANDYIADTRFRINALGLQNSSARLLPAGVVVFTRDAAVGKAAITTRPMAVSQHLIAWVCGPRILNEYLLRVFYAMKRELDRWSFGATIATIGMDDVRKLVTPVPPIAEQLRIAAYVGGATASLTEAINRTQQLIDRMREFRTRLIADVVTGKLDVREAVARFPDVADEPVEPEEVDQEAASEGGEPEDTEPTQPTADEAA